MSDIERAAARLAAGTAAFRRGDFVRARREMERALALFRARFGAEDARALRALSDLGAVHAALGDHAASRTAHEAVLAGRRRVLGWAHQDAGVSLHNLAAACTALGEDAAAAAHHLEAIAIWRAALGEAHPIIARALTSLAALARKAGDPGRAAAYARQALDITRQAFPPDYRAIAACLDDLATSLSQAGDEPGAQAAWEQALGGPGAARAPLLLKLGLSRRRQGDLTGAAAFFAASVEADGTLAAARHHLAAALTRLGRAGEARPHLAAALKSQRIFIQHGPAGAPRVLILASATEGNIPLEHLLPERDFTRIWWFIDHAPDPLAEELPFFDAVFNGLGDPDAIGVAGEKAEVFLEGEELGGTSRPPQTPRLHLRILNRPACVARTRRDRMAALLGGIDGVVVPRVCRIEDSPSAAVIMRAAEEAGIAPPLLLRPTGAHGGAGVLRIESWDGFDPPSVPAWYATSFHDCRAADGFTRKYRVIFVDRAPYAYHLAISPNWLVHYFSAGMEAHAWKLQEEAAFLDDPRQVLGERGWDALREAGRRLDLDYCGMDFGVAGGEIVVFEANPTMLVHPEREGPLAFKNKAVQRIVAALKNALEQN